MKKTISLCMLLALLATVFACVPLTASAGTSVTLADSVSYSAGLTTITWTVEGDAMPTYYVIGEALGGDAPQQRVRLGETSAPSLATPEFIPGKSYRVYVTDSEFSLLDYKDYTMPDPVTFQDGLLKDTSVKITPEPVRLHAGGARNKNSKKINALRAGEIMSGLADGSYTYGLKYTMKMPQLAKPRNFYVTIAFEAPNGFLWTEIAEDVKFDRVNNGYQTVYYYMIGDRFFELLNKNAGQIPQGEYKIHLFWDGMYVNTTTFNVN